MMMIIRLVEDDELMMMIKLVEGNCMQLCHVTVRWLSHYSTARYIVLRPSFYFHILCLYATRWVMTDLLFDLNVYILAWLGALYLVTILALSHRKIVCDLWVFSPEFLSLFLFNQKVGFLLLGRPSSTILAPSPSLPPYYQPPYPPRTLKLTQLPTHSPITCLAIFSPAGVANWHQLDLVLPCLVSLAPFSTFDIPYRRE